MIESFVITLKMAYQQRITEKIKINKKQQISHIEQL